MLSHDPEKNKQTLELKRKHNHMKHENNYISSPPMDHQGLSILLP